ncbi:response regulator [Pacificispira sp.]|uniref:response regulator n=1 Tax=Pacificispira sp. TaxID=2888761 RepID=UPI003BAD89FD
MSFQYDKPSSDKSRDVRIVFGEPEAQLRHAIRAALNREGYQNVYDFDRIALLREAIVKNDPDLVVMDSEMDEREADQIITEMRYNRLGRNPFVPVIVTIWEPTREQVKRVASSGTDDLLVKPLSPTQVFERIKVLVNNRKPFVVTSDYIGPDRRKDVGRGSEIPTIQVPNTLRSKVRGEPIDRTAIENAIREAQGDINDQRLKRNAFQIGFLVNLLLPELKKFDVTDERIKTVDRLIAVSRDTGNRMKGTDYQHVTSLCNAMIRVASSIADSITHPESKDVDLLKPMSEAILAAFNPDLSAIDIAGQISSAVSNYKQRTAS